MKRLKKLDLSRVTVKPLQGDQLQDPNGALIYLSYGAHCSNSCNTCRQNIICGAITGNLCC